MNKGKITAEGKRKTMKLILLNKNEFNEKANKMFVYFVKAFNLHFYFAAQDGKTKTLRTNAKATGTGFFI